MMFIMAASKTKEVFVVHKSVPSYLIVFVLFLVFSLCPGYASKCDQKEYFQAKDYCTCSFDNGTLFTLKGLLEEDLVLKQKGYLTAISPDKQNEYYYQPCVGIDTIKHTELPIDCQNMAACQKRITGGQISYYGNGLENTANITGDPPTSSLIITYTAGGNRQTDVEMVCRPHQATALLEFIKEDPVKHYHLRLTSMFACAARPSGGLSGGSVLLIIFFIFSCVYLLVGLLYMKFARNAQCPEVFPHYEFWSDLPFLIRDGCLFLFSGCKAESTYDKI